MASQHDERLSDNEKENNRNNQNSSSDEDNSSNKKCKHVKGGVFAKKIGREVAQMDLSELNCATCQKDEKNSSASTMTDSNYDLNDVISSSQKDILICLQCAKLHCGRNYKKHALQHYKDTDHPISLNMESLDTWCYKCDSEVVSTTGRNQVVIEVHAIIRKQLKGKETNEEESKEGNSTYDYKRKWQYEVTAPGLTNLGNTCFFNSVMQVVVGTSVLHDVLTPSDPYYDTPHIDAAKCIAATENTENDAGPLTNAFKEFLCEMWRTREDTVTPRELFNQISRKWQQFRGWRQQDSQELMRFLFDGVKSEELSLIRKLQHQKSQDEDEEINEDDEDSENDENHTKKKENENYVSFIDACFGGRLVSVIVCDVCKNCSYSYEEFLDVSLPIKSSDDQYKSKNDYYGGYSSSYLGSSYSGIGNTYDSFKSNNEGSSSHTQSDDGSEHGGNAENPNEEVSSDTEIEEGIPVPNKEERKRIKLLLRDLPSDSGRSTPNSSKEPVTLRDCLKSFVKVETLEKDNSFACDNCWKLKEEYDEKIRYEEQVGENERTLDTDDQLEGTQNTESGGNGIQSQESMEGIEYTTNNTDNTHLNESSDSLLESRMGNEISSDAGDDRHDDNRHDNNNFFNNNDHHNSSYTNSLTTKKSKPVPQSEPKYILRKAYKRYLFDSLPPVLVFHLKRFQQVGGRWSVSMRKIDDFVSFEEELDVGDFVVPPEIEKKNEENGISNGHIIDGNTHASSKQNKQNTKYRLYGVVVHLGSLYNGHYIAYVLSRNIRGEGEQYGLSNFPHETIKKAREFERTERQKHKTSGQRQWIYCSDSSVRSASVEEVLNNSGAYLLFYERVYE